MLRVREGVSWRARIRVIARYRDGRVEVEEFDNLITNVGLNLIRDGLDGADSEIKYVALGSNNTAPVVGDTTLGVEEFRKQVTKQELGATGVMVTTVYIAPFEATSFTIEEIGWFAGVGATATANKGVMVARVLYGRAKTNLESLQIERTDTFS